MSELTTDTAVVSYEDLAGLVEYPLVRAEFSEEDVARGCEVAREYAIAAVIVRPSDVDLAVRWVNSPVRLAVVVDAPFGYSTTPAKTFSARDVLRRGAVEIDTVMNTSKLISRQFQYLEMELQQMADACHQAGAILKVHLESKYLNEELKIVACRISKRAGVDYLASASLEDMPLLQSYSREKLKLKSTAMVDTLEAALAFRDARCARIQVANPAVVLDAWKLRVAQAQQVSKE